MKRVDLHTHSIGSKDGGLTLQQYRKALSKKKLDLIAITDHGTIAFAKYAASHDDLKDKIVVGQEIRAVEGEILGLYLTDEIADGMSAEDTIAEIEAQNGFVIIPHPAEKFRHGMSFDDMESVKSSIDCVEVENGRKVWQRMPELRLWASEHFCGGIASSDAHAYSGIGKTYTFMETLPTSADSLRAALKGNIRPVYEYPPLRSLLAPKRNRIRQAIRRRTW